LPFSAKPKGADHEQDQRAPEDRPEYQENGQDSHGQAGQDDPVAYRHAVSAILRRKDGRP